MTTTNNFYRCFYRNQEIDVQAATTYEAQKLAAAYFKARKAYEVTPVLLERGDGVPVVHLPQEVTP